MDKRIVYASAVVVLGLSGCGGAGGGKAGGTGDSRGVLKMTVTWPDATRLIPNQTQSIKLIAKDSQGNVVPFLVTDLANSAAGARDFVARPADGKTSIVQTEPLLADTYTITAEAYSVTDPTNAANAGNRTAFGDATVEIKAGDTKNFTVTMSSTFTGFKVTLNGQSVVATEASTASISLNATDIGNLTVEPQSGAGGLVLFPVGATPTSTISVGSGLISSGFETTTTSPAASSKISGTILVSDQNASPKIHLTYSDGSGLSAITKTVDVQVNINKLTLPTPTLMMGLNADIVSVRDVSFISGSTFGYLVATATNTYFLMNPLVADSAGKRSLKFTMLAAASTTQAYLGDPTAKEVNQIGGLPASVTLTSATQDLKWFKDNGYALTSDNNIYRVTDGFKILSGLTGATSVALGVDPHHPTLGVAGYYVAGGILKRASSSQMAGDPAFASPAENIAAVAVDPSGDAMGGALIYALDAANPASSFVRVYSAAGGAPLLSVPLPALTNAGAAYKRIAISKPSAGVVHGVVTGDDGRPVVATF